MVLGENFEPTYPLKRNSYLASTTITKTKSSRNLGRVAAEWSTAKKVQMDLSLFDH